MPLKPISATELRTRTREIMQRAKFKHETFLVENFGEPMAVIVNVEEYLSLLEAQNENGQPAPGGSLHALASNRPG